MHYSHFRPTSYIKRKPNQNKLEKCTNPVIKLFSINILKDEEVSQGFALLLRNKPCFHILKELQKNLRSDLEDAIFCRSKRHILKNSFFLQQKMIHCILSPNVKKVSVILKGEFWMLHRKKKNKKPHSKTKIHSQNTSGRKEMCHKRKVEKTSPRRPLSQKKPPFLSER